MTDNNNIIDRIEDVITSVYRTRTVRPWDDGAGRAERFERMFRERLANWPLRNHTDYKHGGSTVIIFLLHPGHYIGVPTRDGIEILIKKLGGKCYQAILEISHLGSFARIRFTLETLNRSSGKFTYDELNKPIRAKDKDFLKSIMMLLDEECIEVLPDEILQLPVSDVELDVTNPGKATVYHCLFDEE